MAFPEPLPLPTLGAIVHYRLRGADVYAVNKRRAQARVRMVQHREHPTGAMVHVGHEVSEGEVYPMIITRVWDATPHVLTPVSGQVFLDGSDHLWVVNIRVGEDPGDFFWPPRTEAAFS